VERRNKGKEGNEGRFVGQKPVRTEGRVRDAPEKKDRLELDSTNTGGREKKA